MVRSSAYWHKIDGIYARAPTEQMISSLPRAALSKFSYLFLFVLCFSVFIFFFSLLVCFQSKDFPLQIPRSSSPLRYIAGTDFREHFMKNSLATIKPLFCNRNLKGFLAFDAFVTQFF